MAQTEVTDFVQRLRECEERVNTLLGQESCDIEAAGVELKQLTKLVSEHAACLPGYELRKAQAVVSKLQAAMISIEDGRRNKTKFKFSRKQEGVKAPPKEEPAVQPAPLPTKPSVTLQPTLVGLKSQSVTLQSADVTDKDIWLDDLSDCTIVITGIPSTLHMTRLSSCRIIAGPVMTSVFLELCSGCQFLIGCQQLRAHKSSSCDFYLHVRSRAIIEDCTSVRFAPYNRPGMQQDFARADLDSSSSNWDQVDDFNWLSTSQASPNWSVVPDDQRVQDWLV